MDDDGLQPPQPAELTAARRALLQAAFGGDSRTAIGVALHVLRDGSSTAELFDGLLRPILREIGDRWHTGSLSAAEANLVCEVVSHLVHVCDRHDQSPVIRGRIVLAGAHGEQHSLAARLVANELRREGWEVVHLGTSAPPDDLRSLVARARPGAVLVSCMCPANLAGAAEVVAAVHDVEVPVVVGGAALGGDRRRARRLGAEGVATTGCEASALIEAGLAPDADRWTPSTSGSGPEWHELRRATPNINLSALGHLGYEAAGAAPEAVQTSLRAVLGGLCGALVVDDEEVVREAVEWSATLLVGRRQPARSIAAILDALETALPNELSASHGLLRYGRSHLRTTEAGAAPTSAVSERVWDEPRPARPRNEPARLAAVARLTPRETELDEALTDLCRLASLACQASVAWEALVEAETVEIIASYGPTPTGTVARDDSFASYLILGRRPVVVPDATADARLSRNPLAVAGPRWRLWAGAPLVTDTGLAIGALGVVDARSRDLDPGQRDALTTIAAQAMGQLELRALQLEGPEAGGTGPRRLVLLDEVRRAAGLDEDALGGVQLLQTSQVAQLLRVSPRTVTNWATEGRLRFVTTTGGHRRFTVESVVELLSAMAAPAALESTDPAGDGPFHRVAR